MSLRSKTSQGIALLISLCSLLALGSFSQLASCQKPSFDEEGAPKSNARRIVSRTELIGGPSALGEIGDFLLENDKIRVIIQDKGYSRGFGVYGGGIMDADLVRPIDPASPLKANGRDQFGELAPAFFLQAMNPSEVVVVDDGSSGKIASVNVRGYAGNFLSIAKTINQLAMNSNTAPWDPDLSLLQKLQYVQDPDNFDGDDQLQYDVTYRLEPGKNFVEIETRITNITDDTLDIPSETASELLKLLVPDMDRLDVPLGFVALFGSGNKVFSPGAGYDIRFNLERRNEVSMPFPALPAIISDGLITTSSNGVSYGFFGGLAEENSTANFAKSRVDENGVNYYEKNFGDEVKDESIMIPFVASAFTGIFFGQCPEVLDSGASVGFKTYFVVGNGDVASVTDAMYAQRKSETSLVQGRVRNLFSLTPVSEASVIFYDSNKSAVNQVFTNEEGFFKLQLPPGDYSARVENDPVLSELVDFTVSPSKANHVELSVPDNVSLSVKVHDTSGRDLPAKVTVTSYYNEEEVQAVRDGLQRWEFLFDLTAGQHWRTSDQIPDDPEDPETMQFIEAFAFTEDGQAELHLRPGRGYKVYVSRGVEYNSQSFELSADQTKPGSGFSFNATLERVVDTTGYISADYHIHAAPSLDSGVTLHDRVISGAAEGLECLVATDHNVITDYAPAIEKAGLTEWTTSMIGLELTTLEAGHFNGYPLTREKSEITKGSFEWSGRPPSELFQDLRDLGAISPEKTIIQVNHARDSILGYFAQHELDELTGERADIDNSSNVIDSLVAVNGSAFYDDEGNSTLVVDDEEFHVLEVMNAAINFQVFHARMPENIDDYNIDPELKAKLPEPGTILCDGGTVAYPGVADDWFNLLNLGKSFTGVANSDSHDENNLGYPRTFVYMGDDDPALMNQEDMVDALKAQKATMSNGPFLEFWINDQPIGSRIDDSDGTVSLKVKIQAPEWVEVNELIIILNGSRFIVEDIVMENGAFVWEKDLPLNRDSWLIAIARGDKSMFPIAVPKDVPAFSLFDAFNVLAGPLGFGSSELSPIGPRRTGVPRPLAMTNPIWVNVDSNPGFDPPGIRSRKCEGYGVVNSAPGSGSSGLERAKPRLPLQGRIRSSFGFPRIHGDIHDIRSIFEPHIGHGHSH